MMHTQTTKQQRVNHDEAAPVLDNPFMASASEAGAGGATRRGLDATAGYGGALGRGGGSSAASRAGSRAGSTASSMGLPPFNEITIPPSPSVVPSTAATSTYSYPATPNFSEAGGTSVVGAPVRVDSP
jgi:hypothetical protein